MVDEAGVSSDLSSLDIHDNSEKVEQQLEQSVAELLSYSNLYLHRNGVESVEKKGEDVKLELSRVIKLIDEKQICCRRKAHVLLCKGKALNVLPQYSGDAFEALSKAVRLEPNSVESWNELGECYSRKRDYEEAIKCFSNALNRSTNKISLRCLSQALRQVGRSAEEKNKAITESVEKAKEAVGLDVEDGLSWECLGTAYLVLFFSCQNKPGLLRQSLQAYTRAESDPVSQHRADLWYNRGFIHLYEEEYQVALEHFSHSHKLEPDWPVPGEKARNTLAYLQQTEKIVEEKGRLRSKKLQQLIDAIKPGSLGPYSGGSYKASSGQEVKLDAVLFDSLKSGVNKEVVVVGKVVGTIPGDMVPFTFCMVDKSAACISVTVYNFAQGQGVIIGDAVAIPEPYVNDVCVDYLGSKIKYRSIRVHMPLVMVVNGKKVRREKMAFAQWKVDQLQ